MCSNMAPKIIRDNLRIKSFVCLFFCLNHLNNISIFEFRKIILKWINKSLLYRLCNAHSKPKPASRNDTLITQLKNQPWERIFWVTGNINRHLTSENITRIEPRRNLGTTASTSYTCTIWGGSNYDKHQRILEDSLINQVCNSA